MLVLKFIGSIHEKVARRLSSERNPLEHLNEWFAHVIENDKAYCQNNAMFGTIKKEEKKKEPLKMAKTTYTPPADTPLSPGVPMEVDAVCLQKLTEDKKKTLMKQGACFKCRTPGHLAANCPTKSTAGPTVQPASTPKKSAFATIRGLFAKLSNEEKAQIKDFQ
jgi:hypothetical protein